MLLMFMLVSVIVEFSSSVLMLLVLECSSRLVIVISIVSSVVCFRFRCCVSVGVVMLNSVNEVVGSMFSMLVMVVLKLNCLLSMFSRGVIDVIVVCRLIVVSRMVVKVSMCLCSSDGELEVEEFIGGFCRCCMSW